MNQNRCNFTWNANGCVYLPSALMVALYFAQYELGKHVVSYKEQCRITMNICSVQSKISDHMHTFYLLRYSWITEWQKNRVIDIENFKAPMFLGVHGFWKEQNYENFHYWIVVLGLSSIYIFHYLVRNWLE